MNRTSAIPAFFALMLAMVGWALAPVFIRFLSDAYDPYSQAFIRYGSATIALVAISMTTHRRELVALFRRPKAIVGIAALNILQQVCWTFGCYYSSSATLPQLITKLNVVFIIVFSYFLFHEERAVIRSRGYLWGTLLSMVGVAAVLTADPATLVPRLDLSALLLLVVALCWGVYIVWAKHLVGGVHPVPMFTATAVFTTLGLGALSWGMGDMRCLVVASPKITAVAVVSGLFPIAMAHTCFHYAQRRLGSAFSSVLLLMNPFLTYLFALLVLPGERLHPSQWGGAAVLLAGVLLVTWTRQRIHARSTTAGEEATD